MPEPLVLEGRHVRLEPLSLDHTPALAEAASEDRTEYGFTAVPDGLPQTAAYVRDVMERAAAGEQVAFATVHKGAGAGGADRVVGATRFYDLGMWQWPAGSAHQRHGVPDAVQIGGTWLSRSAQRTNVNTEAKLLMLRHAFEVWDVHGVWFMTDVRNERSRAAIERIGGQLDGILRADRAGSDDTVRTSARYSIVAAEWPAVRTRLQDRLAGR
jgi:RimJ/RimL family protein N-acetyltransferase